MDKALRRQITAAIVKLFRVLPCELKVHLLRTFSSHFHVRTSSPYLEIRNVHKTFGRFTALDDVSLEVARGEFVTILGPSGCGKTTLLRIIAGLEVQDSGQLVQDGKDVSRLPAARRDFGIVFQSYALFPNLTVEQNIAYGLENARWSKADISKKIVELLALTELEPNKTKYPAQLSGGQQQRVALARALALSPGLLLLDEPLSALDARVRANLRGEITALQKRLGITTVMVTHDQAEALTMADRVVVMNKGHIEQVAAPYQIYHRPATLFVADFVGEMNVLPGTITEANELSVGPFTLRLKNDSTARGPVKVAIRPEDLQVMAHALPSHVVAPARLESKELLGPYYRLHLRLLASNGHDSHPLIANLSLDVLGSLSTEPDRELYVQLPADKLHIFPN